MKLLFQQNPVSVLLRPIALLLDRLAVLTGWKCGNSAMAAIAERAGLIHCVWSGRWGVPLQAAVGMRDGFAIYIGPPPQYWRPGAGRAVVLRSSAMRDEQNLRATAAQLISSLPDHPGFEIARDSIEIRWPVYRARPAPWRLAKLVADLVALLKESAVPLAEVCEFCGADPDYRLTLLDRRPVLCCPACQTRVQEEAETAERSYLFRHGDSFRALAFCLPACLIAGIAWAAAMMFYPASFTVASTMFLGILIAWVASRGRGKADWITLVLSFFLTLVALILGIETWYLLTSYDLWGLSDSYGRLEVFDSGGLVLLALLFGEVGAWALVSLLRPRFRPRLEELPMPAPSGVTEPAPPRSRSQAAGQ